MTEARGSRGYLSTQRGCERRLFAPRTSLIKEAEVAEARLAETRLSALGLDCD